MHAPTCACGVWRVTSGEWRVVCGMWHVACGRWGAACMRHVACACASSSSSCACLCVPVHVCQAALSKLPSYSDHSGALYNHNGEVMPLAILQHVLLSCECAWPMHVQVVPAPSEGITAWQTDELLPLRCPHPPTCCRMATLIRQVCAMAACHGHGQGTGMGTGISM